MEVGQVKNIDYCYWDEIELSLTHLHVVAEKSVRRRPVPATFKNPETA